MLEESKRLVLLCVQISTITNPKGLKKKEKEREEILTNLKFLLETLGGKAVSRIIVQRKEELLFFVEYKEGIQEYIFRAE
jgi:hypothetical protein